jgi:hypothetical protein
MVVGCLFQGLGSVACLEAELTSKTINDFIQFSGTPTGGGGGRPIARPLRQKKREET